MPTAGAWRRAVGSSPLTRGKQPSVQVVIHPGRLIPAHAGKTVFFLCSFIMFSAHPRSRGENVLNSATSMLTTGSSPLTRGKPILRASNEADERLIPAHAGKTHRGHRATLQRRAHPRSRGENINVQRMPLNLYGSSPLTRGKRSPVTEGNGDVGLIPAHAGKTRLILSIQNSPPAHPRSRGENICMAPFRSASIGSSPLTRGKRGP